MNMRAITLTVAAAAVLLWSEAVLTAPGESAAAERAPALSAADEDVGWPGQRAQAEGGDAVDGDTRVPVQVWTVLAAVGAAGVGLVLFLVRMVMGWVKPPPAQEESHH